MHIAQGWELNIVHTSEITSTHITTIVASFKDQSRLIHNGINTLLSSNWTSFISIRFLKLCPNFLMFWLNWKFRKLHKHPGNKNRNATLKWVRSYCASAWYFIRKVMGKEFSGPSPFFLLSKHILIFY